MNQIVSPENVQLLSVLCEYSHHNVGAVCLFHTNKMARSMIGAIGHHLTITTTSYFHDDLVVANWWISFLVSRQSPQKIKNQKKYEPDNLTFF